jgi:hypothetical protein
VERTGVACNARAWSIGTKISFLRFIINLIVHIIEISKLSHQKLSRICVTLLVCDAMIRQSCLDTSANLRFDSVVEIKITLERCSTVSGSGLRPREPQAELRNFHYNLINDSESCGLFFRLK